MVVARVAAVVLVVAKRVAERFDMEITSNRNTMKTQALTSLLIAALGVFLLSGCGGGATTPPEPAPVAVQKAVPKPEIVTVDAGVPLAASNDPKRWQNLIAVHSFAPRKDPFALEPVEQGYENRQEAERLVLLQGDFSAPALQLVPENTGVAPVVEPQPYRRLAGVLVGDSVLAIIEMGNGRPAEIVRPGQKIQGTDWTVVSIDQEKAVLRRGGNKLPHEVIVRLESKPFTAGTSTTTQPGANPGNPAGSRAGGGTGRSGGGRFGGGGGSGAGGGDAGD